MGFHGILCQTRVPSLPPFVLRSFCTAMGASTSLSSGYHPESNGLVERTNQCLENALRCVAASMGKLLAWVEYAHNSLVSSASGVSPFMATLGYQPPLFDHQEREVAVPSVQA